MLATLAVALLVGLDVSAAPRAVSLVNADATMQRHVSWALGLFAQQDLPAPTIASIRFSPDDPICEHAAGWYEPRDDSILICFDTGTLRRDAGEPLHPAESRVLVHEMAHAWTATHAGPQRRVAFGRTMGCETWNDPAQRWHERCMEIAAETFVWALTDGEVTPRSIASRDPEQLAAGFALLAG